MPDISMCQNKDCPLAGGCYRFRATPGCRQSYADFKPDADGECVWYWPTLSQQKRDEEAKQKKGIKNAG